jgi:uncharacterized protein YegJ (DUF2314 family)
MLPVYIAVGVILFFVLMNVLLRRNLPETLSHVDPDSPEMIEAIASARKSLPYFWDKRATALNPEDYMVKVAIEDGEMTEHFWLKDPRIEGENVIGTIENDPGVVKTVKYGETVTVPESKISDWMYSEGDLMHGNYTARVLAKPQSMGKAQYEYLMSKFAPLPTLPDDN